MKSEILVQCEHLTKIFPGKKALDDVNLKIGRGKVVGLLGPNGSGKTTLIKILNGLLQPNFGSVMIDATPIGTYTKSQVSYLPDKNYFADWMTVKDIFDLFSDFYADFDRQKALHMCDSLGIGEGDRIKSMSKGTKEKVQLILVMSRNAQLYLLDEPIAGVDPAARDYIMGTIINNYADNATVVISTHLIADIERVLDEVIFLKDGRIVRHETVDGTFYRLGGCDVVHRCDAVLQRAAQGRGVSDAYAAGQGMAADHVKGRDRNGDGADQHGAGGGVHHSAESGRQSIRHSVFLAGYWRDCAEISGKSAVLPGSPSRGTCRHHDRSL